MHGLEKHQILYKYITRICNGRSYIQINLLYSQNESSIGLLQTVLANYKNCINMTKYMEKICEKGLSFDRQFKGTERLLQ